MGSRAFVLGVVVAALGVCAPSASAAFPGRDGALVVATGGGLDLVAPATGAARSICSDAVVCGDPVQPRFSPNGRAIVYVDAASGRLVVLGSDGSCLWCLVGTPLTPVKGSEPAFMPGGQSVTVGGNGLLAVSLTGGGVGRLVRGPVDRAVWSSRGLVAFVRGGFVWVGRPGHGEFRRLAPGGSPSFSPDGELLAVTRGGNVWVVRVGGGSGRRLVEGSAPAWSPDGRQIAYIGVGGLVEIIAVGGGRPQRVGSVRGTTLDWQPIPPSAKPACTPPVGATVLAADSDAVVFSPRYAVIYGCLTALGRPRLLLNASHAYPYFDKVIAVRLAGRFAVLEPEYENQYSEGNEDVMLYDLSNGAHAHLAEISWNGPPTGTVYGFDSLAVGASGFAAWLETSGPVPTPIDAVSCPSVSLCVAADAAGDILSSTNPTRGPTAWSIAPVGTSIGRVSCPSTSLCVAVDEPDSVLSSTDPTGGANDWTSTQLPSGDGIGQLSCPSVSLCVASGGLSTAGDGAVILTSTDPTGGASDWASAQLASGEGISELSCPSVSLCVATNEGRNILTSTDPTGGASAWTATAVGQAGIGLDVVSCPSVSLCVVGEATNGNVTWNDNILTSTDPTGGASTWKTTTIEPGKLYDPVGLNALTCPSVSLCVASDNFGNIVTSTDPTGGASAWTTTTPAQGIFFTGISCPSVSLCVGVDAAGNVLTSTDPAGGANTWNSATVDVAGCPQTLTPCASEQLFAYDGQGTRVIDTTPPGPITAIANVTLAGDLPTLTWTHDGAQQQLELR